MSGLLWIFFCSQCGAVGEVKFVWRGLKIEEERVEREIGEKMGMRTRNFLFGESEKMAHLPEIRRAAAVPEEKPLQGIAALDFILESELFVCVVVDEEVEQFRTRLHDRVRG